jgi:hypothetical protein
MGKGSKNKMGNPWMEHYAFVHMVVFPLHPPIEEEKNKTRILLPMFYSNFNAQKIQITTKASIWFFFFLVCVFAWAERSIEFFFGSLFF